MNFIKRAVNFLRERVGKFNKNKSFKDRLFYLFEVTGLVSSFFAYVSTTHNGLSTGAVYASLFCVLIMLMNLLFVTVTGNIPVAGILCCISLNFIMFPILFLVSGGAHSGMPFYLVLGLTVAVLILNGIRRIVIVGITMLIDTACYYYYYTNYTTIFQLSREQEFNDSITSYWIVNIFFIVVFTFLINEYDKEQKKIINRNMELNETSQRDSLTKLYNHRFVEKNLVKLCQEAMESGRPFSVVLLDIDFFKKVNDEFGHLCGNQVLMRVSRILSEQKGKDQFIIRFGGEEFLLLLRGYTAEQAFCYGEKIRRAVVSDDELKKLTQKGVTISGGIAEYSVGMTAEELLDDADRNLYKAKNTGRNKICI